MDFEKKFRWGVNVDICGRVGVNEEDGMRRGLGVGCHTRCHRESSLTEKKYSLFSLINSFKGDFHQGRTNVKPKRVTTMQDLKD